jgi:hypothetical protein
MMTSTPELDKMKKAQKYGKNNFNLKREINPIDFVENVVLKRLDHLFHFVKNHNSEFFEDYVMKLQLKFKSLAKKNILKVSQINIQTITKFENLKNYPNLIKNIINFCLDLLELQHIAEWINKEIELYEKNILKARLFPKYYSLLVLTEVTGKEKAFKLFKESISHYFEINPFAHSVENLEILRENYIQMVQQEGVVRILSEVENGKLIIRKETCPAAELLKEFNNPELSYVVECYEDLKISTRFNKHFKSTLNYTLIEGFPYCDMIVHDTSINSNLDHPPKGFFDNLYPLHAQ